MVSLRSNCLKRKVAAVIVHDRRIMEAERGRPPALTNGKPVATVRQDVVADPAGKLLQQTGFSRPADAGDNRWTPGPGQKSKRLSDEPAVGRRTLQRAVPQLARPCPMNRLAGQGGVRLTQPRLNRNLGESAPNAGDEDA